MTRHYRHWMMSLVAAVMVVLGSTAGVSAYTGGTPGWDNAGLGDLRAGPLGLNQPVVPEPVAASAQLPVAMSIPGIGANAGVEIRSIVGGVMQDPTTPYVMAWYDFTSYVGSDGNAVFAGHVNWYGEPYGVLYGMTGLPAGSLIYVTGAEGGTYTYEVEYIYRVNAFTLSESEFNGIVGDTGYGALTIITCSTDGGWTGSEYVMRDILRARLVSSDASGGPTAAAAASSSVPEGPNAGNADALASGDTATVNSDTLNLRADPSSDGEIVGKLALGDSVTVTGEAEIASGYTWWPVTTADGLTGWAAGEFLLPPDDADDEPADEASTEASTPEADTAAQPEDESATGDTGEGTGGTTDPATPGTQGSVVAVTSDTLNVRAEPTTDSDVVTTLVLGDEVTITGRSVAGEDFTWWPVETADGTTGWVAEEFIEPPAGETPSGD